MAKGIPPSQAMLACFQELSRPFVVRVLVDPLLTAQSAMDRSPRNPTSTMRIFSSALYFLRVFQRMFFTVASTVDFFSAMIFSFFVITIIWLKSLY
jgi:hypothetical protein